MPFRKLAADILFDGYKPRDDQHVLIAYPDGTIEDIVPMRDAGEGVERFSGILCPGFVNCHCHLELSHMKGIIPVETGLVDFIYQVVSQRHFPDEKIREAITAAENEMIANGIVAVGDICNNTLTIPQKSKDRLHYHNFIEASGFNPKLAGERYQRSLSYYEEYGKYFPSSQNSIVPHAPYSVVDGLWEQLASLPGNDLQTIHNQETEAENRLFRDGSGELMSFYNKMGIDSSFFRPTGRSSLQSILPKFTQAKSVILVHNIHTSEEDIDFALGAGKAVSWCFCPGANLYIERQLPVIDQFVKKDCHIVLGTDSLASNRQLSILEEIRVIHDHFPAISVGQLLGWATINGARALQIDHLLGSFEQGKRPGVLVCDADFTQVNKIL